MLEKYVAREQSQVVQDDLKLPGTGFSFKQFLTPDIKNSTEESNKTNAVYDTKGCYPIQPMPAHKLFDAGIGQCCFDQLLVSGRKIQEVRSAFI